MSQSHVKKLKQPPPPIIWWRLALASAVFLGLFAALFLFVNRVRLVPTNYETANGKILEIRNVVDGTLDTQAGGKIFYGAEAHVQFLLDGQMQDRWMRASDDLSRESLVLKL